MRPPDPGLLARARQALGDDFLRSAVRHTTDRLRDARERALAALPDAAAWRQRARAVRQATLVDLAGELQRFVRAARSRGTRVHFAADAAEARAHVLQIARARGARTVVKSKSMLAEEIELNEALDGAGLAVVETDLGEWIVQLAGEKPSHIILPAIHKSRAQVQALFAREGGAPVGATTAELAGHARRRLRERFLAADLGVTGANFAVAADGALALFTNEGNGRLVTSLPRTQIALLGVERIVPDWDGLVTMAELLPRSATGQAITTYLNVIRGPRRPTEADGPDELHVVVVDNGRSALLADPALREILHCIRCGACLNVCPVYAQIGGHAYGSVYPGPLGAVLTPSLQPGSEGASELAGASSLCGACTSACPVGIPLDDLLVRLRAARPGRLSRPTPAMRLHAWACARPWRFRLLGCLVRIWLRWCGGRTLLAGWRLRNRAAPKPPDRGAYARWSALRARRR